MSSSSHGTSLHFDPFSPEYERNPHPLLKELREHFPAFWWPQGPAWLFSRYDDALTILKDPRFTSDPACWERHVPKPAQDKTVHETLLDTMLFSLKPPDHARIRALVQPAFSPKGVQQLAAPVTRIVDGVLDRLAGRREFDLVGDFAATLPMAVMCHMLRVPPALQPGFLDFGAALFRGTSARLTPAEKAAVLPQIAAGIDMLQTFIEQRRAHPEDDLLSQLIHAAQADGQLTGGQLTEAELIGLVASLVAAGMDTTIQHIVYSVHHLMRDAEQRRLVDENPLLLANGLQEVLRYDFFARTGPSRYATQDIELAGVTIRQGQLVFPCLAAALRDPRVFSDPDRFDVRRDQSRSLAFGGGIYHCLGVHLARLEVQIAVARLLARYPRLQPAGEPRYAPEPFFRTLAALPVSAG